MILPTLLIATPFVQAQLNVNDGAIDVNPTNNASVIDPNKTLTLVAESNTQLGVTFDHQYSDRFTFALIAAKPFSYTVNGAGELKGSDVVNVKH